MLYNKTLSLRNQINNYMNITQRLKTMVPGETIEVNFTECKGMTLRTLCWKIGGEWEVREKGLTTTVKRIAQLK